MPAAWFTDTLSASSRCIALQSRRDFVSPEGLRIDGRRANEIRRVRARMGLFRRADGSSYFQIGNTGVLAAIYGPHDVSNRSKTLHDRALINCEFNQAKFAGGERRNRFKGDRRSIELAGLVKSVFESVVFTSLYPRTQIDIYLTVVQADGGEPAACINAASLALIDAGIPMADVVAACSAGFLDNVPLLDLNYIESASSGPELPIALLCKQNKVASIQLDSSLPLSEFTSVSRLAVAGCQAVYQVMLDEIEQYTLSLVDSRGLRRL